MKLKISDEHKLNLKCLAIAILCFCIDIIDGGIMRDSHINGLVLWLIIGFSFGIIRQNYKENKR